MEGVEFDRKMTNSCISRMKNSPYYKLEIFYFIICGLEVLDNRTLEKKKAYYPRQSYSQS